MGGASELQLSNQKQKSHLLVKVAEVVEVGVASTAWILIGAAGVWWPLHLCHLQPIGEVDHPTTLELRQHTPVTHRSHDHITCVQVGSLPLFGSDSRCVLATDDAAGRSYGGGASG